MNIVSWTLAGPGTSEIIGDALRSVMWIADLCAIIDTAPEHAITYQIRGDVRTAGEFGAGHKAIF